MTISPVAVARWREVRVNCGQQAYTFSVSTDRRIPIVRGVLGLAERVHLFLKYTEHSYLVLVASTASPAAYGPRGAPSSASG